MEEVTEDPSPSTVAEIANNKSRKAYLAWKTGILTAGTATYDVDRNAIVIELNERPGGAVARVLAEGNHIDSLTMELRTKGIG